MTAMASVSLRLQCIEAVNREMWSVYFTACSFPIELNIKASKMNHDRISFAVRI